MTVLATISKLQSLHAGITGIVSAPTERPASLSSVKLPFVFVTPGPANWNPHALGLKREEREYTVEVIAGAVAQGRGIDQNYQKAIGLLDAFGDLYINNQTLDNTVDHIGVDGGRWRDSGVQNITIAGVAYWGFTIVLPVTEKTATT